MSADRRLVVLPVSPWSERASWALDHHGLDYRKVEHIPFLGERRLRRLVGARTSRATVPVLLAGGEVLSDSWDIAVYADREGSGSPLIPAADAEEIRRWYELCERTMAAARALTVGRMLVSEGALEESLPPAVPRLIRRALRPVTRYGMVWFARKYALDLEETERPRQLQREALDALRAALAATGYVRGSFSYADIIAATLLQAVVPVAHRYIRLGRATREVWTQADLAADYADLIRWRDELYERHRGRARGNRRDVETPQQAASGAGA
jgi:glutathione S-transferase